MALSGVHTQQTAVIRKERISGREPIVIQHDVISPFLDLVVCVQGGELEPYQAKGCEGRHIGAGLDMKASNPNSERSRLSALELCKHRQGVCIC